MVAEIRETMMAFADACKSLVQSEYGENLDYSLNSLVGADNICAQLMADGPLSGERLDLWMKLLGAYTGEVLIRTHGGEWATHDNGDLAVAVYGLRVFTFSTARRLLEGEVGKSLASVGRAIPAIRDNNRNQ